jgi:hypothetical protein
VLSKKAITKLQAILIIDLIVIASAATGFYYVSTLPGPEIPPAKIQMMELQVTPQSAFVGQDVAVSVNVTNIGGESGTFPVSVILDGTQNQVQTVKLAAGEVTTVEFTISGASEGTHIVGIGSLEGSFTLENPIEFSTLAVNRTEAQIGEPIGITIQVTNKAPTNESYSLTLSINDSAIQTKAGQVEGNTTINVLFEVVEQTEGTYQLMIANLSGTFKVSPAAPPPKPAEFTLSDLTIDPQVVDVGNPIGVTAKVTNVGETSGSYSVDLIVNGEVKGTRTLQLSGGETTTVTFTITQSTPGTLTIKVGNMTGTAVIQEAARILLYNIAVTPAELWGGQVVTVTTTVSNVGQSTGSIQLKLLVDDALVETRTIQLDGGAYSNVQFKFNAEELKGGDSMKHSVNLNGFVREFTVVKTGYHTFSVQVTPDGDADFTLILPDGVSEPHKTPYVAILPEGKYTIILPLTDPTGAISFLRWDDQSTNLTRTVNLTTKVTAIGYYSGGSSCPSLFLWNGTDYVYVSEVSNHGWLGYLNYISDDPEWPIVYYRNNPWDYIPLDSSQLAATNGYFNLSLIQRWNEIFYLDQASLVVVDHPADVNVYSTMEEQYLDPNYMGNIYTVSKNPLTPISAVNDKGEDVLSQISKMDGVFTNGTNGIQSPTWDNITWSRITVDFGDLSNASQIKLVVKAIVDWGSGDDYTIWLDKFFAQTVPNGTEVTPPPYMEVKAADGSWIRVPQSRDFPLPPDGLARTYVVDLTGLFPEGTTDYQLRISNFWNVTFDYIGVDTTPQQNITIQVVNPQGYLYQANLPGSLAATGNFTEYGNVTELLLHPDDMFAMGRQGDAVSLQFYVDNLPAPAPGMVRDYFLNVSCWFKDITGNWGFGFDFTADPLPFQNMTGFPYPPNESYPNDIAHQNYLKQWNTRVILPVSPQTGVASQNSFVAPVVFVAVLAVTMVYANFKFGVFSFRNQKRAKRI